MAGEGSCIRGFGNLAEPLQPYLLCIFACMCYAGNGIIVSASLKKGVSCYVLIVYAQAIAALTSALTALVFERGNRPRLKPPALINIFFLALLGPIMSRTVYYIGLGDTSASFASAMHNLCPSFTFLLAILCRMENLEIVKIGSQAKVLGTIVALGGATLMTLYKGIAVLSLHPQPSDTWANVVRDGKKDLVKGSIVLIASSISFSCFYVLQIPTLRQYPAPFARHSLVCLVGTLQAVAVTLIMEPKASAWRLGWDITLLTPLYSGVLTFGIGTCAQILALRRRGPVFLTSFEPLITLMTTLMGLLILGETLYLGGHLKAFDRFELLNGDFSYAIFGPLDLYSSVVGAVLIVIGLYLVLWGKQKDINMKAEEIEPCCQPLIDDHDLRESNNEII